MFAVPGWNLTATLKTQAKTVVSSEPKSSESGAAQTTKKRKRDGSSKVNGGNVAELWAKHIDVAEKSVKDGEKDKIQKQKKRDKKNKKQKLDAENRPSKQATGEDEEGKGINETEASNEGHENKLHQTKASKVSEAPSANKVKKQKKGTIEQKDTGLNRKTNNLPGSIPASVASTPSMKLTPLQASMRAKLSSARFRHLNETLYTTPSSSSLTLFSQSPEMFEEYHAGFRQQVGVWPENPVESYIGDIKKRGKIGFKANNQNTKEPLPRTKGTCVIADFGCGDAKLASELQPIAQKLHLKIHSFDLHNPSPLVTKADISALPLPSASIDIGIFCLALMGTNWPDFVDEAFRVLRWKGELWIAEIKSRFGRVQRAKKVVDHSVGKRQKNCKPLNKEEKRRAQEQEDQQHDEKLKVEVDGNEEKNETDVSAFVEVLKKRGFLLKDAGAVEVSKSSSIDLSNKMFVKMIFVKGITPVRGKNIPAKNDEERGEQKKGKRFIEDESTEDIDEIGVLKPCVYKLR